jgi:hypothetical protein
MAAWLRTAEMRARKDSDWDMEKRRVMNQVKFWERSNRLRQNLTEVPDLRQDVRLLLPALGTGSCRARGRIPFGPTAGCECHALQYILH